MDHPIRTMGRLFADGTAIEQLRSGQLIIRREAYSRIDYTVIHNNRTYAAVNLVGTDFEDALQLPTGPQPFKSLETLTTELAESLRTIGGLSDRESLFAAGPVRGSWVCECLPAPLIVNFWGAAGGDSGLEDLLYRLCRRALRVTEASPSKIAALPPGLSPTLFLRDPSERALLRLIAAVGRPATYFVSGGRLFDMCCPLFCFTSKPVTIPALKFALSSTKRVSRSQAEALGDYFQPQLLQFRLEHHARIASSNFQFDLPHLTPEVRAVTRIVGPIFEEVPALHGKIIEALKEFNEQQRSEQSEVSVAVLESLVSVCHLQQPSAFVGQITHLTATTLENRGEKSALSPKAVGRILREEFGFSLRRQSPGYELSLNDNAKQQVHRLAYGYGVLHRLANCAWCQQISTSINERHEAPENTSETCT